MFRPAMMSAFVAVTLFALVNGKPVCWDDKTPTSHGFSLSYTPVNAPVKVDGTQAVTINQTFVVVGKNTAANSSIAIARAFYSVQSNVPNTPGFLYFSDILAEQPDLCIERELANYWISYDPVNNVTAVTFRSSLLVGLSNIAKYDTLYTLRGFSMTMSTNGTNPIYVTITTPNSFYFIAEQNSTVGDANMTTVELSVKATPDNTDLDGSLNQDWLVSTLRGALRVAASESTDADIKNITSELMLGNIIVVSSNSSNTPSVDIVSALSILNLTTFADLVNISGFTPAKQNSYTILAPTNAAWDAIDKSTLDGLKKNKTLLLSVVEYHIFAGKTASYDLPTSTNLNVTSLEGAIITINSTLNKPDSSVHLTSYDGTKKASVVSADNVVANGVIHTIDAVLTVVSPETPKAATGIEAQDAADADVQPSHSVHIQFIDPLPQLAAQSNVIYTTISQKLVNFTVSSGKNTSGAIYRTLGLLAPPTVLGPPSTAGETAIVLGVVVSIASILVFIGVAVTIWRQHRSRYESLV